jgi:Fe-S cluster assembly protein SufD
MIENFEKDIENIKNISFSEKKIRKESLKIFNELGFPNRRLEDWKFTDLNSILGKNFNNIENNNLISEDKEINIVKEFEHNSTILKLKI